LDLSSLPTLNASLNAISTILLIAGYVLIRRRRAVAQHRACMIAAFATSTLFLISYVIYHANIGSRPFTGVGPIRVVYFTILITCRPGSGGSPAGDRHAGARPAPRRRAPSPHRAVDVSYLALCVGDGGGRVRDALQDLAVPGFTDSPGSRVLEFKN
jgi:hypothetical protein